MQFVFGDYSLDVSRRELRRGSGLVAIEPQVFDLLVYLLQNRDRVVTICWKPSGADGSYRNRL
jgi:DNA-binding winged helix-turn-helix (wHTH) protein